MEKSVQTYVWHQELFNLKLVEEKGAKKNHFIQLFFFLNLNNCAYVYGYTKVARITLYDGLSANIKNNF